MRRGVKCAVAGVGVVMAMVTAACSGQEGVERSMREAAQGAWDCVVTGGGSPMSAIVTVRDGRYTVRQEGAEPRSGAWTLSGGTLRVKGDDGPYVAEGVPDSVDASLGLMFGEGNDGKLSALSVSWKDDTVTFPYHGLKVSCRNV